MSCFNCYLMTSAAGVLVLMASTVQPASAVQPFQPRTPTFVTPSVRPIQPYNPNFNTPNIIPGIQNGINWNRNTGPIGGDWRRTYPWSDYNAWKNPYWYPPHNNNYPFPPDQANPYVPYPMPPYPQPDSFDGGIGSSLR